MSPRPFEAKAYSMYGASMGRRSDTPANLTGRVHLQRVPACDGGDYDPGGAYWGDVAGRLGNAPIWCAWDDAGTVVYLRALDRIVAKMVLASQGFEGSFYR